VTATKRLTVIETGVFQKERLEMKTDSKEWYT